MVQQREDGEHGAWSRWKQERCGEGDRNIENGHREETNDDLIIEREIGGDDSDDDATRHCCNDDTRSGKDEEDGNVEKCGKGTQKRRQQ